MIITCSPLRITLGGGGTDLPSYFRKYGGFVIAAAIDKYVCVSVAQSLVPGILVRHAQLEHADNPEEIRHPIVRESLKMLGFNASQLEITSFADIPAGSGLGSSGSFTTALLKALSVYQGKSFHREELAQLACKIEIDCLKKLIGKQDQYIAAYGGITCFHFHPDDTVEAIPLKISEDSWCDLQDNLLIFFTGITRNTVEIFTDQIFHTNDRDQTMLDNLHYIKELGMRSRQALENGDTSRFGELMHEHWECKRRYSKRISTTQIDEWYQLGRANGAIGGKLVGAGGGGFLMFYAYNKQNLRKAMYHANLQEVRFGFDLEGTRVLSR